MTPGEPVNPMLHICETSQEDRRKIDGHDKLVEALEDAAPRVHYMAFGLGGISQTKHQKRFESCTAPRCLTYRAALEAAGSVLGRSRDSRNGEAKA